MLFFSRTAAARPLPPFLLCPTPAASIFCELFLFALLPDYACITRTNTPSLEFEIHYSAIQVHTKLGQPVDLASPLRRYIKYTHFTSNSRLTAIRRLTK
jgi:hypothetical protein